MISPELSIRKPIPFTKLIDALLDENIPFHPRYLNRLSDLNPEDAALLCEAWPKVSLRRRKALLEDLEEIHLADDLLCFEEVGRIAFKDMNPDVRVRAIRILREYEMVDLLPAFQAMAERDPDTDVRAEAAAALGMYIYMGEVEDISPAKLKRVEECLLSLLSNQEPVLVQRRALESMGFSSRNEVPGLIEKAYTSEDMDWVISSLYAMGRSANSHWYPKVLKMLTHPHPGVRAEAAGAAGELEIKASRPALVDLLDDADFDVRMAAIWSLSQVGGKGVRKALERSLETTEDDEEADQIEKALDNLDFTEEMQDLAILDISEDGDGTSEDDYADSDDDFISEEDMD